MVESHEPDESAAEIRIGPLSVPYAVLGIGIAVGVPLFLLGALGIAGNILTDTPHTDCALGAPGELGWVQIDVGRMSSLGRQHTLNHNAVVFADRRDTASRVCMLPRGTRVTVHEKERGRDGSWLLVHGDGVTLPR